MNTETLPTDLFNHIKGGTWTGKIEALLGFVKLDILVFLVYLEKLVSGNRGISTEKGQMVCATETKLRFDVPKEDVPARFTGLETITEILVPHVQIRKLESSITLDKCLWKAMNCLAHLTEQTEASQEWI